MLRETKKRLSSKSPDYFKKIQYLCLTIGGIMSIIGGTLVGFPNTSTVGGVVLAIGGTIAGIGTFLAKLPNIEPPK